MEYEFLWIWITFSVYYAVQESTLTRTYMVCAMRKVENWIHHAKTNRENQSTNYIWNACVCFVRFHINRQYTHINVHSLHQQQSFFVPFPLTFLMVSPCSFAQPNHLWNIFISDKMLCTLKQFFGLGVMRDECGRWLPHHTTHFAWIRNMLYILE